MHLQASQSAKQIINLKFQVAQKRLSAFSTVLSWSGQKGTMASLHTRQPSHNNITANCNGIKQVAALVIALGC